MDESARLRRRSPPRLRRWRSVLPEEAGMGQVPERDTKAASDRVLLLRCGTVTTHRKVPDGLSSSWPDPYQKPTTRGDSISRFDVRNRLVGRNLRAGRGACHDLEPNRIASPPTRHDGSHQAHGAGVGSPGSGCTASFAPRMERRSKPAALMLGADFTTTHEQAIPTHAAQVRVALKTRARFSRSANR